MSTEVHFEVDVACIDQTYGVTILVSDTVFEDSDEEVPYYFLVFKGPTPEVQPDDVAKQFMAAHSEAMTSVGLEGQVDEDKFEALLEDSVELAGELMIRHGFNVLDVKDVDEELLQALFEKAGAEEETEPSLLN